MIYRHFGAMVPKNPIKSNPLESPEVGFLGFGPRAREDLEILAPCCHGAWASWCLGVMVLWYFGALVAALGALVTDVPAFW